MRPLLRSPGARVAASVRLLPRLAPYVQHRPDCDRRTKYHGAAMACTCGLAGLLEQFAAEIGLDDGRER